MLLAVSCLLQNVRNQIFDKFNYNPSRAHWNTVEIIFQYLQGTRHYKLHFKKMTLHVLIHIQIQIGKMKWTIRGYHCICEHTLKHC